MKKVLLSLCLAIASVWTAPLAVAANGYTLGGWVEIGGPDDFTYAMPNPEANFKKTCARGANGWASWMYVGQRFKVYNGANQAMGTVRVTAADWVKDYGIKGNCYYYLNGTNIKRANYYCITWPNGVTDNVGEGADAKNGVVPIDGWVIPYDSGSPYVVKECGG